MLKVGLTGSIAVGKTFVCDVFRELGCHVMDADIAARQVVEPGTEGLRMVTEAFGREVLTAAGSLDRSKLASIVFSDEGSRQLLNSIVHPLVFEVQDNWMKDLESKDPTGIAIVDAALMIESVGYRRFEKLIVVWCEPEIQLQRLMLRDSLSEADALKRISSQMPQEQKKTYADYLIDTSAGLDDTRQRVLSVYLELRNAAERT